MKQPLIIAGLLLTSFIFTNGAQAARDYINVVGSSTVYPFSTVVAERFGKSTQYKTPKIESTGSGGGLKLFCQGVGVQFPDITNASRRIKASEMQLCADNGVDEVIEVLIGYDGIVIGNSIDTQSIALSTKDIFMALAKQIPNPDGSETLLDNPYTSWQQVNPALPDRKIEVLGPPPTSGTRDAFAELALEGGCQQIDWIADLKLRAKTAEKSGDTKSSQTLTNKYKSICHTVREDGFFVEAGENDNLILQKLNANPNSLGIFGFSFLDQNLDKIQGSRINGFAPSFDSIADGYYPVSRPLYFYVKKAHVGVIPGFSEFLAEFTSNRAIGDEGYLTEKGMIPLRDDVRQQVKSDVESLKSVTL